MTNSVRTIVGSGLPPQAAQAISGTVLDSQTATGTTQATGFPISNDNVIFTTVAASTGATLPNATLAQPGDQVLVSNLGANTLTVYPPVGGTINALAANAGFSVATLKGAVFTARNGGLNWVAILSA